MFEILSTFVQSAISVIIEKAAAYGHNNLELRRSILSKLLILYNSLQNLRESSQKAKLEFDGYQSGAETPTKVVSAKRLEEVIKSFSDFRSAKREVEKTIKIYDSDLSVLISRSENLKFSFVWNIVNITDSLTPKMIRSNSYSGFILSFPTRLPKNTESVIDPTMDSKEKLSEKTEQVRRRLIGEMDFIEVDIRDPVKLQLALSDAEFSIETLLEAEKAISKLIQENFSLDQVFEASKHSFPNN